MEILMDDCIAFCQTRRLGHLKCIFSFIAPSFFNQDCTSLYKGDEKMRFKRMFIIDRCWMLDASDWTMRTISIVL